MKSAARTILSLSFRGASRVARTIVPRNTFSQSFTTRDCSGDAALAAFAIAMAVGESGGRAGTSDDFGWALVARFVVATLAPRSCAPSEKGPELAPRVRIAAPRSGDQATAVPRLSNATAWPQRER